MNPFKQRSSIPSSFLTGIIGWVGFIFVGPLIFGFQVPSDTLFILGLISAITQVAILRLVFFILRMNRHLSIGAFWGLVSAIGIYFVTVNFYPDMASHQFYWLLIYAYIGAPVGAFLSYFYIDDKKIFDQTEGRQADTNFGRDAHWLEPFGYGALAYLIIFFPFAHFDLSIHVFIVGAISGVFAAGASHFSPDSLKKSIVLITTIIVVVGGIQGFASGLLFRGYTNELYFNHLIHGTGAGILTYLITFIRGRQLAGKEEKGEL